MNHQIVQKITSEDRGNIEKGDVIPHDMTLAEDLLMGLCDQADGLDRILQLLLVDCAKDENMRNMLFSQQGIESVEKGLGALEEVIYKYEEINKARK